MRGLATGATGLVALVVLLVGLLPPHVMETGQLDPHAWLVPGAVGLAAAFVLLRWIVRQWLWPAMMVAAMAVVLPPLALCVAGSAPGGGRLATWFHRGPVDVPVAAERPVVGVLSGPVLHGPAQAGAVVRGFRRAPLWQILSRRLDLRPVDAVDAAALRGAWALLVIQPRALAPEELVVLDKWVRMGGRAVLLADPDLRWADHRALGHPLRAPPASLLGPLLAHWGVSLAPAASRGSGDPIERRMLEGGRMIQIAGASHFLPSQTSSCSLASEGLVARCPLGRGMAVLVADADFANDALWTSDPSAPGRTRGWTSDAAPALAEWLVPGAGEAMGRRVWLARADGLSEALRGALAVLGAVLIFFWLAVGWRKSEVVSQS